MRLRLLLLAAGLLGFLQATLAGGLLAIDYGTEWMKASLVKPGIPFDVLLNVDSKRKIQSVTALKGDDRWVGGDAANLASRFPDNVYPGVKFLLGHSSSDVQSQLYETIYRTRLSDDPKSGKASYDFASSSSASSPGTDRLGFPEEVLALQFNHVKKLAKDAAGGEAVLDVVVTVPIFFTQSERQAVLDAVELAGLRPLALIDDGSAVAINYAMTRNFPSGTPEHHLFYDAGAGSIRSTIVSFQTGEVKEHASSKKTKEVTLAEVKGVGWDKSASGLLMDAKIRDMLEQQFVAKEGSRLEVPLDRNRKAQAKLLKEASRVKQVLSANVDAPSRIEGLAEDIDFRGLVSRASFEESCAPIQPSFTQPIRDSLRAANLTMDDITSVVLVGGISRVPMVRNAVISLAGESKIAQNLNADEAAVMGAALYGAALSSQFRTKDIRLTGVTPYGIDVTYEADGAKKGITSGAPRLLTSTIFAANSKTGVKKTMTFKKTADFPLHFRYKSTARQGGEKEASPAASSGVDIATIDISGVTEAFANLTEAEAANATVKVAIQMTDSNLLEVQSAQLVLPESKDQASMADKIKGFFGGGSKDKDASASTSAAAPQDADAASSSPSPAASDSATDSAAAAEEVLAALRKVSGPVRLNVTMTPSTFQPMAKQDKKDAIKRLRDLDVAETRKRNREEARNGLEAYLYRLRDQLESAEFVEASTEAERVKVRKQLEEANEWLWDAGETAPTKDLKSAKSELERSAAAIVSRLSEASGRSKAVTELRVGLVSAQAFLLSATKQHESETAANEVSKYTEAELKSLEASIASHEKWLEELEKRQASLKKNEDPVLRISELERRRRELNAQVTVLQTKRPPRKNKKTTTTTSTSAATTTAESATSTALESEQTSSAAPTETQHARDEL